MKRLLPPLNALVAFDAVARHLNFTHAATELFVTQGAVSRQVLILEDHLRVKLFERKKTGLTITPAGRKYAERVAQCLEGVERATNDAKNNSNATYVLNVNVVPTFGMKWIVPRLPDFSRAHPDIHVNLVSDSSPVIFGYQQMDVAIRGFAVNLPDCVEDFLMGEEMVLACSPKLLKGKNALRQLSDLKKQVVISHTMCPDEWVQWCKKAGLNIKDLKYGQGYEHIYMLVPPVKEGHGVALFPRFFIENELRNKELVLPFKIKLVNYRRYNLITEKKRYDEYPIKEFREWVLKVCG